MRLYVLILSVFIASGLSACKEDVVPGGSKFPPPSQVKAPPSAQPPKAADAPPPEQRQVNPADPADQGDTINEGDPPPPPESGEAVGEATDGIIIQGVTTWDGPGGNVLNIDLIKKGPPARVVYSVFNVPGPGPFKINAPRDLGEVYVYAFLEQEDVVAGGVPAKAIAITDTDIDGVVIPLKKSFKLSKVGLAVVQGTEAAPDSAEEGGENGDVPPN